MITLVNANGAAAVADAPGATTKPVVVAPDLVVGGEAVVIMAGPCAVESYEQTRAVAQEVANAGIPILRGGAFKPRTSPYSFQGLGREGLEILRQVADEFGLLVITEALGVAQVDLVSQYADIIQIGSRNMQHYPLLWAVGETQKPILLKRGFMSTIHEWLLAAEHILSRGNDRIILCERGIRTFADHARNTLDISIVPAIRRLSHLPVVIDPSHASGHNYMVEPLARAGVAVGADGLLIEVHPCPEEALCDGAQALTPQQYLELNRQVQRLFEAINVEEFAQIPA